jgi:hypothetical protein
MERFDESHLRMVAAQLLDDRPLNVVVKLQRVDRRVFDDPRKVLIVDGMRHGVPRHRWRHGTEEPASGLE